jgi:hypothetical protein
MKKALLLALASLLTAVAPALAQAPANVNFTSERGVPFGLVLDGRPLTRGVAREVHVDQLVAGQHWADFTIPAGRGSVRFRSQVWLQPGLETTFMLVTRPGRAPMLRQVGAVALYVQPLPGNGHGQHHGGHQGGHQGGGNYGNNGQGNYNNGGSYNNGGNGGQYGNGYNNGGGNNQGGAGYYPGSAVSSYRAMPPQDVDALLRAVEQRPFEATKLSTAKEAISQSSIRAEDLKRLMRSMGFESSRVELAKYAYEHVADRQNFYQVYEAFDFDSSVQEVQQAIGAPRG